MMVYEKEKECQDLLLVARLLETTAAITPDVGMVFPLSGEHWHNMAGTLRLQEDQSKSERNEEVKDE